MRILGLSISVLMITLLFLGLSPPTYGQNIINSNWRSPPPIIDGIFTPGEWSNPQLNMQPTAFPIPAFAYFVNNALYLYVLVDAVGDWTDDPQDECLLVFHFNIMNRININIIGAGGFTYSNFYDAAVGYSGSRNNSTSHKIYEFRIPFSYINSGPGQSIEFCSPYTKTYPSMPWDYSTSRDNVYPHDLVLDNSETWATINFASTRAVSYSDWVGGTLTPINKLAVLAPYLSLIGVVATIATVLVITRRRT